MLATPVAHPRSSDPRKDKDQRKSERNRLSSSHMTSTEILALVEDLRETGASRALFQFNSTPRPCGS